MTRNSLLVATILVALVLGGVLWFVLTPDAPEELAQAGTRPASETLGAVTTQKPVSGTETQGQGQPDQPGSNVGSSATRTAEAESTESATEMASAAPAEAEAAAEPEVAAAAPPPAEPSASAAAPPPAAVPPPSFDIVRVEKDGSAVIAGRAEPGTLVQLLDGEQVLAEAEAGADGSFAVVLDEPLAAGTRRLSLTATGPDGMIVPSEDEVVVVVAGEAAPAASSEAVAAAEQSTEAAVAAVESASEAAEASSESATAAEATAAETSTEIAAAETAPAEQPADAPAEPAAEATAETTAESTETTASDSAAATEPAASGTAAPESAELEVADTPALAEALEAEQDVASASSSSEPAPQAAVAEATNLPLVVVQPKSGEGASQVLQSPTAAGEKPTVSIEAVDYDLTGQVVVSGRAPAGAQVLVYLDHAVLGQASADGEGRWQLRPDGNVAAGLHRLRADLVDAGGAVLARAEIPFQRAEPIQVAADEEFIVVQPGHSLWVIARKTYGQGVQYSAIYEANAGQIRNPHLIYPGQIFLVPTVN